MFNLGTMKRILVLLLYGSREELMESTLRARSIQAMNDLYHPLVAVNHWCMAVAHGVICEPCLEKWLTNNKLKMMRKRFT